MQRDEGEEGMRQREPGEVSKGFIGSCEGLGRTKCLTAPRLEQRRRGTEWG